MLQVATLHVCVLVQVYLVEYGMNLCGLSHAAHEEQTGTDEAKLDGDGEVEDDGEEERQEQHGDVALGIACHCQERTPATHAIGNDDEYASQTGHRDVLCQRHEEQEDEREHDGMNDASHWSASAIVDVGHGAGDGSCSGNAAKDGRGDVGDALSDELRVGIVVVANDTISHSG